MQPRDNAAGFLSFHFEFSIDCLSPRQISWLWYTYTQGKRVCCESMIMVYTILWINARQDHAELILLSQLHKTAGHC